MQKYKPPLDFLIKIIGMATGKELALINPLPKFLFKYFYNTKSLF